LAGVVAQARQQQKLFPQISGKEFPVFPVSYRKLFSDVEQVGNAFESISAGRFFELKLPYS
jgi:hypothetical protein